MRIKTITISIDVKSNMSAVSQRLSSTVLRLDLRLRRALVAREFAEADERGECSVRLAASWTDLSSDIDRVRSFQTCFQISRMDVMVFAVRLCFYIVYPFLYCLYIVYYCSLLRSLRHILHYVIDIIRIVPWHLRFLLSTDTVSLQTSSQNFFLFRRSYPDLLI